MQKYNWVWRDANYYVDVPNFEGGAMYLADEADARIAELSKVLGELIEEAEDFIGTDSGFPFEEAVKRAKQTLGLMGSKA